jgi:hypothetical protein
MVSVSIEKQNEYDSERNTKKVNENNEKQTEVVKPSATQSNQVIDIDKELTNEPNKD